MSVTPTNDTLNIALRAFIMAVVPGVEVVQGLGNGVPMPAGEFIAFTPTLIRRLSTNHTSYAVDAERAVTMPSEYSVQVDCYGPNSADHATAITALWRDQYGCEAMAPSSQPLYSTDPQQMPLVNGEENYEQRFMFTALLQFNPLVTLPQQSALTLAAELISVDAEYPPQ